MSPVTQHMFLHFYAVDDLQLFHKICRFVTETFIYAIYTNTDLFWA